MKLFFSKIELHMFSPLWASQKKLHNAIWSVFGSGSASRPMYRVEIIPESEAIVVIVQSKGQTAPSWRGFVEQNDEHLISKVIITKEITLAPPVGAMFYFRLLGNTISRLEGNHEISIPPEEWIHSRESNGGFEILELTKVEKRPRIEVVKKSGLITYNNALLEGHLRVTNQEKFEASLGGGVGRGKVYGMGMLSLFPAKVE